MLILVYFDEVAGIKNKEFIGDRDDLLSIRAVRIELERKIRCKRTK